MPKLNGLKWWIQVGAAAGLRMRSSRSRKFFDLARLTKAPIAAEAVQRIDALFAIEREINGLAPQERRRVRQERSRSLIVKLKAWLRDSGQALQEQRYGQGNQLLPRPLGCIHPLP